MATKKTTSPTVKAKAAAKSALAKKPAAKKATAQVVKTATKVVKPPLKAVKASSKVVKTPAKAAQKSANTNADLDVMFDLAAETFRVMSAPMRLKIINCLCSEEKNVGQLLEEIDTTQPNMSQHLNTLFKSKILGRRREGVQIYYRIINERVVTLCRAVCTQIAIDSDIAHA
jgi:DNA-binding transcriptional ArsR family regulator